MTELKTLKDVEELATGEDADDHAENIWRKQMAQDLRLEAIKWVRLISDKKKCEEYCWKKFDEVTKNDLPGGTYEVLIPDEKTACWIIDFFNLTEEDY